MEPADLTGIACIASREEMDLSDWLGPAPHLPTKLRVPGRFVFAISRRECLLKQHALFVLAEVGNQGSQLILAGRGQIELGCDDVIHSCPLKVSLGSCITSHKELPSTLPQLAHHCTQTKLQVCARAHLWI